MENRLVLTILLLFTGCTTTLPDGKVNYCRHFTENIKVCKDINYFGTDNEMCRFYIDRKEPYNDTKTEKFRCEGVW